MSYGVINLTDKLMLYAPWLNESEISFWRRAGLRICQKIMKIKVNRNGQAC